MQSTRNPQINKSNINTKTLKNDSKIDTSNFKDYFSNDDDEDE